MNPQTRHFICHSASSNHRTARSYKMLHFLQLTAASSSVWMSFSSVGDVQGRENGTENTLSLPGQVGHESSRFKPIGKAGRATSIVNTIFHCFIVIHSRVVCNMYASSDKKITRSLLTLGFWVSLSSPRHLPWSVYDFILSLANQTLVLFSGSIPLTGICIGRSLRNVKVCCSAAAAQINQYKWRRRRGGMEEGCRMLKFFHASSLWE